MHGTWCIKRFEVVMAVTKMKPTVEFGRIPNTVFVISDGQNSSGRE